jgi:ABC-type multidrug transport system fused ATPase/permease subunit
MFFRPIRDLSEKYNIMQTAMASSERIFKLLDNQTMIKNPENPVKLENVKGSIEFKNVWFAYNEEDYVLKDISFRINPGETVAIVGHTGAGKTSIINILTRFYDINKGEILLDGINIENLDKRELRKHISMVLQDVFLFSGNIKSNINLDNEEISDEKIIEASGIVGADKFIRELPQKYDEEVKERGATLSVGQKQLISFARALAYNPKILILDEATSSIDTESEHLIKQAIEKLLVGRTAIVIAHRLSTIQNADKIIVLHKGEIRETGNHQELLAKRGIYFKLYQLQYKDQEITVSKP